MRLRNPFPIIVATLAVVTGIAAVGYATRAQWLSLLAAPRPATTPTANHSENDHTGHDHDAEGDHAHGDANSVAFTEQARANLGLKLGEVSLAEYTRSIVIPGTVIEQPGHSERRITTSLTGVVVKVHAFPGQTVEPGDPLLDIQPTGELLTTAQSTLLNTLQDIELVDLELKRITPLVESGSIPGKTKIEKEYERKRLESQRLVQMQELLVRGLSPEQITEIVEHKVLLRDFTLFVPGARPKRMTLPGHEHPTVVPTSLLRDDLPAEGTPRPEVVYTVEQVEVFPGKLVQPGDELLDLALHTELYLEGHAFERDSGLLSRALQEQWPITALFEEGEGEVVSRDGLKVRYIDNSLDATTRTLRFFVPIKNEVLRDTIGDNGLAYRSWRFKPGQKVRLLLPVERLSDQIVLPADAVVTEGPDAFVFRANGKLLERVPVAVLHRDPRQVAIRNDGSLFPGDDVALNQAYQINLALKKQQGSGVDMHAGHQH